MRKTFVTPEGKKITPRKGKYIAQGAHASMKALLDAMHQTSNMKFITSRGIVGTERWMIDVEGGSALNDWLNGAFTKVCCVVETEEEVVALYEAAKKKGLLCSLIKDSGQTEFGGVPTITCCAIGPAWSYEVDEITGELELF